MTKALDKTTITQIGDEMARQDNLSTQYPLWVVSEEKKNYVGYDMSWDGKERAIYDGMDDDEFLKALCSSCRGLAQEDYDMIPDECPTDACDYDTYHYYEIDPNCPNMTSGAYLTQKACQDHIDENRYHYNKPHTYAFSAWRNPEMIAVMQHILHEANQEIPSYYQ